MAADRPAPGLARNTLFNLVAQATPLLAALLAVPVLTRTLGAARFGVLALAWMTLSLCAEIGFARATTKFLAEALEGGFERRASGIVWTAVAAQAVLGLLAALALFGLSGLLAARGGGGVGIVAEARQTFLAVAAILPVVFVTGPFRSVLEAARRFDRIAAVVVPSGTATYLIPLAGALAGWRLPAIVGLLGVVRLAVLATYAGAALRLEPAVRRRPDLAPAEVRAILGFGSWTTVSSLVSPALSYLDRFFLATLVSVAALGYYAAPYELAARMLMVPLALTAAAYPAFSALGAARRMEAARLAGRSVKVLLLLVGPVAVTLVVAGPDVLRIWLGPEFAARSGLALRILALGVLVNALAHVPFVLLQGFGRADLTGKFHLLELPLHVGFAWFAVLHWGVAGAALAWTLRVTLDAGLLFWAAARLFPAARGLWAEERLAHALLVLGGFGVVAAGLARLQPGMVPRLTGVGVALVTSLALLWRWALLDQDRAVLVRVLRPRDAR